jgi:hypothetical protein
MEESRVGEEIGSLIGVSFLLYGCFLFSFIFYIGIGLWGLTFVLLWMNNLFQFGEMELTGSG